MGRYGPAGGAGSGARTSCRSGAGRPLRCPASDRSFCPRPTRSQRCAPGLSRHARLPRGRRPRPDGRGPGGRHPHPGNAPGPGHHPRNGRQRPARTGHAEFARPHRPHQYPHRKRGRPRNTSHGLRDLPGAGHGAESERDGWGGELQPDRGAMGSRLQSNQEQMSTAEPPGWTPAAPDSFDPGGSARMVVLVDPNSLPADGLRHLPTPAPAWMFDVLSWNGRLLFRPSAQGTIRGQDRAYSCD